MSQLLDITPLVVVYIIAFSIAFMLDLYYSKRLHFLQMPIICGYLWRIALLFFDIYGRTIYHLPNSGADSEGFWRSAVNVAYNGWQGELTFPSIVGMVFRFTGVSRVLGQFIGLMFSIIAILALALIMIEFRRITPIVMNRIMWIVGLLPNYAILSSIFLRESIVSMFMTLSAGCFVLWITRKKEWYFLLAVGLSLMGSVFHSGSIALVGGYVVVRMIYDNYAERITTTPKTLVPAILLGLLLMFLFTNYGDTFFSKMTGVESIADIANESTEGGSSYSRFVGNSSTPFNMVIFTIPRIVYFLFSPFPWQWRGLSDIIAFTFSSLFYMYVVVRVIKYLRRSNNKHAKTLVIMLAIVALAGVFVFAWGVSNTGTAARHREKMFLIFALLYACTYYDEDGMSKTMGRGRIV